MISEKLSGIYNKIEDKYFDALDFLDKKGIPIYKYSDFFENKGIPSLVVTIAIIVAIIVLLTVTLTYHGADVGEITLSLKDNEGRSLANVDVTIKDAQDNLLFEGKKSDGDKVTLPRKFYEGEELTITAEVEGYQPAQIEFTIGTNENTPSLSFDKGFTGIEAKIRIIDNETKTIVSDASVLASSNNLTYQFYEDLNGIYKKTGVPSGVNLLLNIKAEGYNEFNQTITFNENQVREAALQPSNSSFVGIASVAIEVKDEENKQIDLAKVLIYNQESGVLLLTGYTSGGVVNGSIQAGIPLRIEAEKEGFLKYNSDLGGGGVTIRTSEAHLAITMRKGGKKMHVLVNDAQSGFGIDGAIVMALTEEGNLISQAVTTATGTDFTGLDSNGKLYFTAQKEGYLPQRQPVNTNTTENITLALQKITASNSARMDIYTVDEKEVPINAAKIMIYDINGEKTIPYGIPEIETGFAGYTNVKVETGKKYLIKASTEIMQGRATTEIKTGEIEKKVSIKMEKKEDIIQIHFIDVFGKDIIGTAEIEGIDGEILYDDELNLSSAFFDAQKRNEVIVKVTQDDQNTFTEKVTLGGNDYIEVVVYEKGAVELAPTIEFVGIENENGDTVKGMTPGAFYWAKFSVSFPRAATLGGVHFRVGEDDTAFSESEKTGIYDLSIPGASITYSQSYTPTPAPGNETIDRANTGAQGEKNKWSEGKISTPAGTYAIKVKLRTEDYTPGKIQLKYRAWAIASSDYYRMPEDTELGTSEHITAKSGLYAKTSAQDFILFESLPACSDSICINTNFVDENENYYNERGFEALKGSVYALEIELNSLESDYVQINASTDSNIAFNSTQTDNFGFMVDRTGAQASSKKTASAALSLTKENKQKIRFYFTPGSAGPAEIKITISGNTSVEKKIPFNIVEEQILIVELSSQQVMPGRNFTVKVMDSGLKGISNAFIKIIDKTGQIVKSVEGDGTEGKGQNGAYTIINNLSPGLYTVEVTAPKYKSKALPVLIAIQGILAFPETLEAKIPISQKTIMLSEDLQNISEYTITGIAIQTDSQEKQTTQLGESVYTLESGNFKIKTNQPQVLGSGQTQKIQITINYIGDPLGTADESATLAISGMVEGKFLTKTTSTIHMTYNRKLDPSCLEANPSAMTLSVLGTAGSTDTAVIELTNNCDEHIQIPFAKNKLKEKTARSLIELSADDIDISPGETKNLTITARNLVDRGSARTENFGFELIYDSNYLKKKINVNVQTINPLFALNYPPQVTLWLAQPNIADKATAAQPLFISNISSFPVDNISFAIEKDYATSSNLKISIEPPNQVSLLQGQAITPPKVLFAQANSKITEPVTARIIISGKMNQLANRAGQLDNYNYYNNYAGGTASQAQGLLNSSAISSAGQYGAGGTTNQYAYQNPLPLNNYSPQSSLYYANPGNQMLGIINVTVLYSGYNCLQAHLTSDGGSYYFPTQGGQMAKIISVVNTCAEPVRVTGASPASSIRNVNQFNTPMVTSSVMLTIMPVTVRPGETAKIPLNVMTAIPNTKKENYQIVVTGVSEISQTLISSKPFGINIYSGLDTSAEHIKANKVNVKICSATGPPTKEEISMPKIQTINCAEGYCDAKDAAGYLAQKIWAAINKARAAGYEKKNSGDAFSCQNTERACTFEEIGMTPEQFDLYLQNDNLSADVLDRAINTKEMEGVNTTPFRETTASTGFWVRSETIDPATLKPLAFSIGYDRMIFVDREISGCGYYRLSITGVFKAGVDGLETMNPILAIKVNPINGKARLETNECKYSINNIANFNPIDKGLNPGSELGTWMTTIETDPQLEEIAAGISKARYGTENRVAGGNGNKLKITRGTLTNALAQMCIGGSDKKTITVTIDSAQANAATAKDAFNKSVIKMVSDALNGAFQDNCLTKNGETYTCINLVDSKNINRKLSLSSSKLIFASNKESCVSATVYSNYQEQLSFNISPGIEKQFIGVRKITIRTDDTKTSPASAINQSTLSVPAETAKTNILDEKPKNSGEAEKPATEKTGQAATQEKETPKTIAKVSLAETEPKTSTDSGQIRQPPRPNPSAPTQREALESGELYTFEIQGGTLAPNTTIQKTLQLKLNPQSTKEYKYYRNIKICATPSEQTQAGAGSQTAYIQANGVQFDVSIYNPQQGESNAADKSSKQTITIQTGTLHPEDLIEKLCSGIEIGEDKPYYFTLMWASDGENTDTFKYNQYVNGLKNIGKYKTCTIFDNITGKKGTEAYEKTYTASRGKALLSFLGGCTTSSLACNAMLTGVGAPVGVLADCGIPLITIYKNDLLLISKAGESKEFQKIRENIKKIPGLGPILADFLQEKETPPKAVSYKALALTGGASAVAKTLINRNEYARLTSGFGDTGFVSKWVSDKAIKETAAEVSKFQAEVERQSLQGILTSSNPQALDEYQKRLEKGFKELIEKEMKTEYEAMNGKKSLFKRVVSSSYTQPEYRANYAETLKKVLNDKAKLDAVRAKAATDTYNGVPLIKQIMGAQGEVTQKDILAKILNPNAANAVEKSLPGAKSINVLLIEKLQTGAYAQLQQPPALPGSTVTVNNFGSGGTGAAPTANYVIKNSISKPAAQMLVKDALENSELGLSRQTIDTIVAQVDEVIVLPGQEKTLGEVAGTISGKVNPLISRAIPDSELASVAKQLSEFAGKSMTQDQIQDKLKKGNLKRIFGGTLKFGKVLGCSILSNEIGGYLFNSTIDTAEKENDKRTISTTNQEYVFQKGRTYKMVLNQLGTISAGFTEVNTQSLEEEMEKNLSKRPDAMLISQQKKVTDPFPEERKLLQWFLNTNLITAADKLKKYEYPYNPEEIDKQIQILKDSKIQKLIYYYTSPQTMAGNANSHYIDGSDEGLAIAIMLYGWNEGFSLQQKTETEKIDGWLREKLLLAAKEKNADNIDEPEFARKIFGSTTTEKEAEQFGQMFDAWQQIARESPLAKPTT